MLRTLLARLGQAPGAAHVGPAACGQGGGWGRHRHAHAPCRMGSGPAEPGLTQNLSCPGSARLCGPAPPPLSICCFVSSAGGQAAWGWGTRRPRPQAPQSRSRLVPSPQALRVLGPGEAFSQDCGDQEGAGLGARHCRAAVVWERHPAAILPVPSPSPCGGSCGGSNAAPCGRQGRPAHPQPPVCTHHPPNVRCRN